MPLTVPDRLVHRKGRGGAFVSTSRKESPGLTDRLNTAGKKEPGGTAFFASGTSNRILRPPCELRCGMPGISYPFYEYASSP